MMMMMMILNTNNLLTFHREVSLCGVVVNVLDCDIVINVFEFQLHYDVHFQTNTIKKRIRGSCGVKVIAVGNGHGDPSSNPR